MFFKTFVLFTMILLMMGAFSIFDYCLGHAGEELHEFDSIILSRSLPKNIPHYPISNAFPR